MIGWNCIQRRNIALLEAIKLNPDIILTIDDDNYPVDDNYKADMITAFTGGNTLKIQTTTGWYNPGDMLFPNVVARGYPLSQRHVDNEPSSVKTLNDNDKIGVVASLWLGDPDIDAVERICCQPDVTSMMTDVNYALHPDTWAPFNTQATAFRTIFAPFMMVWPGVGRYDDIWASYLTQRAMEDSDYRLSFGHPLVRQDRNPHNLVTDLKNEIYGMEYNEAMINEIRNLPFVQKIETIQDSIVVLNKWYDTLYQTKWLPDNTCAAFDAWYADVDACAGEL